MLLQSQRPSLRPLTTAHLAQTMSLLELSAAELFQKIESELANNPALELANESFCPSCRRRIPSAGLCPVCSRSQSVSVEEPIVFVSPREDFHTYGEGFSGEEMPDEEWASAAEELPAYVLRQIAPELEPEDRQLAAHILTSLDEDGLLSVPLLEIARYNHVPLSRVQKVLQQIQRADPVGVGSPSPKEALLVQLQVLAETRPIPPLTARAVEESLDLLSRHAYHELGRLLKISASRAQEIAQFISDNLNPYPARAHWGDSRQAQAPQNVYRTPDVIISFLNSSPNSPLVVEVVSPYAGALRINPLFREALPQAPSSKTEHWQSDLEKANLLVKCLQQRDHTLVRLMQRLVALQHAFVIKGDAFLSPVTRAELADELEVHESTISRAVSGKAVQLPSGHIIPMSKFFDRSLHIRTALRQIVAQEVKPLSDTQLSERLSKQGYSVARRTVAKYRAMEGILPARFRQPPPAFEAK